MYGVLTNVVVIVQVRICCMKRVMYNIHKYYACQLQGCVYRSTSPQPFVLCNTQFRCSAKMQNISKLWTKTKLLKNKILNYQLWNYRVGCSRHSYAYIDIHRSNIDLLSRIHWTHFMVEIYVDMYMSKMCRMSNSFVMKY